MLIFEAPRVITVRLYSIGVVLTVADCVFYHMTEGSGGSANNYCSEKGEQHENQRNSSCGRIGGVFP